MTTYFVTEPTSLLGRLLIERLLQRDDCEGIYALVTAHNHGSLAKQWPDERRIHTVVGDLAEPGFAADVLPTTIDHVVQLSSEGTQHVLDFATTASARCLHAVAPSLEATAILRQQVAVRLRIYRTSLVVGDSRTGEAERDGSLQDLFGILVRAARLFGPIPIAWLDLGTTNLIPVDAAADQLDHLIHVHASSGITYYLAAAEPQPIAEVYNAFARAAGAPRLVLTAPRTISRASAAVASGVAGLVDSVPMAKSLRKAVLGEIGLTGDSLAWLSTSRSEQNTQTREALEGSGISVPAAGLYAATLYTYWRRELDPDRYRHGHTTGIWGRTSEDALAGRTVLITGASSGIGRETAVRVARLGANVIAVARRADELEALCQQIRADGGAATAYPCDLSDGDAVDSLVKNVLADHGTVDVLVNNAGRSIRRSVLAATDRPHDYERTMAVNYFAAVRLTLGFAPAMREQRFGHIVNITTQGLQNHTPRFSAYLASKAALDEFGSVAGRETLSAGITFSSVRLPLVSTEMTAPSEQFNAFAGTPMMDVDRAAKLVIDAIVKRREHVNVLFPAGLTAQLASVLTPHTSRALTHIFGYETMPDDAESRVHPIPAAAAAITRLLWRLL